jgi:hypothetical protein
VTLGRGSPGKRGFFPPGSRPAGFSLGALLHNPQSVPGPDPLHGVDDLGTRQRLSQFLDRPLGIPRPRLDVVGKDALGLVDRIQDQPVRAFSALGGSPALCGAGFAFSRSGDLSLFSGFRRNQSRVGGRCGGSVAA